jgi:hypothetical protein
MSAAKAKKPTEKRAPNRPAKNAAARKTGGKPARKPTTPSLADGAPDTQETSAAIFGQVSRGIRALMRARELRNARPARRPDRHERSTRADLDGQPFDRELLEWSRLFRRSRELYAGLGGRFESSLVSSPRTLSSAILLEPRIEYSPIERELVWAATDPAESRDPAHFLTVRTYCASLFHEQNHRILWRMLPPPSPGRASVRRYLHLAEALVIASDMALADELEPARAELLYHCGPIYSRGTDLGKLVRSGKLSRREYRNYLHATAYITYLLLERVDDRELEAAIPRLFPQLDARLRERAYLRAGNLDPSFIEVTNPAWQQKHGHRVAQALAQGRTSVAPLELPADLGDTRLFYLHAEAWYEKLGA